MGWTSIVLREATTNLIRNPSFETDTTYITNVNGAASWRITSESKWGAYSLGVTPSLFDLESGIYQTVTGCTANAVHTFSTWVKGVNGGVYRIRLTDSTPTTLGTLSFTGNGEWQYVYVTGTASALTTLRCYVEKVAVGSLTFWVDGMQLEEKDHSTTYCDGDQAGCEWNGTYHGSSSSRSVNTRHGGLVVDLDDYGLCLDTYSGYGFPPITHNTRDMAIQPGALMDNIKVLPRVLTLTTAITEDTKLALHNDRRRLINLIKHDAVACLQPFILRWNFYTDSTDPLANAMECYAFYDTGLQGRWQDKFHEEIGLRFIAYDPFWYGMGEDAEHLDTSESIAIYYAAGLIGGEWADLGITACDNIIRAIVSDDTYVYFGGYFTGINGIPNTAYIARRDKVSGEWSALGTGMNNPVFGMTISPDGNLYVGGIFTTAGGGAANRVAMWDTTTEAWSALGAGLNNDVWNLLFGYDGDLYVVGTFTDLQGGG